MTLKFYYFSVGMVIVCLLGCKPKTQVQNTESQKLAHQHEPDIESQKAVHQHELELAVADYAKIKTQYDAALQEVQILEKAEPQRKNLRVIDGALYRFDKFGFLPDEYRTLRHDAVADGLLFHEWHLVPDYAPVQGHYTLRGVPYNTGGGLIGWHFEGKGCLLKNYPGSGPAKVRDTGTISCTPPRPDLPPNPPYVPPTPITYNAISIPVYDCGTEYNPNQPQIISQKRSEISLLEGRMNEASNRMSALNVSVLPP